MQNNSLPPFTVINYIKPYKILQPLLSGSKNILLKSQTPNIFISSSHSTKHEHN